MEYTRMPRPFLTCSAFRFFNFTNEWAINYITIPHHHTYCDKHRSSYWVYELLIEFILQVTVCPFALTNTLNLQELGLLGCMTQQVTKPTIISYTYIDPRNINQTVANE